MKNKFLFFFLLGIVQLASNSGYSQISLRGSVVQASTGAPISEAEVYNLTNERSTRTDALGNFQLTNLDEGVTELAVFSFEYETLFITVILNQDTTLQLELTPLQEELSEVMIWDRRQEAFALRRLQAVEGTAVYAGKKSEVVVMDLTLGNLATNNSRQIYSQIVGLNIYEGNDGGLQLGIGGRGLDPNRTSNFNTRQNGYDISADVLGYPESYYTPPAEALMEIQVVRGAASLQYGTQFGGLVNFKLRQPPKNRKLEINTRQTLGSFGLFNSFNSIGGTVGKFGYYAYFQYKRGDGYRNHSGFDAQNFYGFARYDWSERTSLSIEGTYFNYLAQQAGGLTDAQFRENPRQSTRTRNWFEVDWKLYNARLDHQFSPKANFSLNLFALDAQRNALGFRGNPTNLNENPITALDEQTSNGEYVLPRDLIMGAFKNWGVEARWLQRYQLKEREAIFLVGTKIYQANNSSVQGPGSKGTDADFRFVDQEFPDYANQSDFRYPNFNWALFGEHILELNSKWTFTPGFRLEYIKTESEGQYQQVIYDNAGNAIANNQFTDNRDLTRFFALFGLGISYQPNTQFELYGNLSRNYRSVTFSDIRVVNPSFVIDPAIRDEKGYTLDLGMRGRFQKKLSYEAGLFGIMYDDRIGIILDDRANRVRKNIGRAVIAGLETFVDVNLGAFILPDQNDFKLNWFFNNAYTYSRYVQSEENNVVGKKVEFIPDINLKTGLKAGHKNLTGALQWTYLSAQFTDVENSAAPSDGDVRSGIIGPIDAYSILDLSLSYRFHSFRLETGMNNILDRPYYTRRATGYPGPGIIPSDGRNMYFTLAYTFSQ